MRAVLEEDIARRKRAEEQLQASLEEKEALLKEVHHRVKNNLQLISSLLSLQAARIAEPAVAELFAESRNRVRSMALVHENLYRAGNFARISMATHIQNLCARFNPCVRHERRHVELAIRIGDVQLDLDRAVPCGLIVNELVSNALKHAFPDGRAGRVCVELQPFGDKQHVLVVGDDGVGLPADLDHRRANSLGLQLVDDLTQQLHGHHRGEPRWRNDLHDHLRDGPPRGAGAMTPARILVVEDDRVVARDIQHQLTRIGHTVVGVTPSGEDAVRLALESHPDLVLMDVRLEGALDGVDAAQQIRDRCQVPVVFLTAYADDETLERARVTEPFGYLLKPFEDSELRTVIEMALYKHAAERKLRESERRYAVTLASIGDAVIATDDQTRVTFLNPVAEVLTGWPQAEATGRPLAEVFHIINEETRQPVEDPAAKVLRLGIVVGLANHTVLLARDGREVPIDDCGAPIIDDRGSITGVVLVFRDTTLRRQAEEAAALRLANARLELALRGSNIGIWEIDMPDGDFRRRPLALGEHLGATRLRTPRFPD